MKLRLILLALFSGIFCSHGLWAANPFAADTVKVSDGAATLTQAPGTAIIKASQSLIKLRAGGYNIAHARGEESGGLNEIGKPSKLKGIARLVKNNKLDIIGFTEISKGDMRVLFRNQPKFIAEYLGYHHVYAENFRRGLLATQGNALVTRFPIVSHQNHLLYRNDASHEQRGCLEAILDLGKAGRIMVLVAHLSLVKEEATRQIEEIWNIARASRYPVILCGDFNSRPKSERIKWLSEQMKDASANLNTTYKNLPDVKIDYLFIYGPWRHGVSKVTGFDLDYSDHGLLYNDFWLMKNPVKAN
ncbi:MAG TPA: endonuclease/exonuclease/phosphatase family protein [Candidatus Rifleibacterium sp.]|nr:endonuclease/exonuclease/phosphatase family protein [Candidatus Rifleibacterium sp.]HPT44651.1 endonuclease/exonuclease/phosphatase family protein [Candidatus Rifleibacterium sp.]